MLMRVLAGIGVLCLTLPAAGFAQGFSQGDKSLALSGSGANDEDFDNGTFSVEADLGYFFTDNLEGAIRQGVVYSDVPGSGSNWSGATRVAADYNFDMGQIWPFIGANLGYIYGDGVHDTWLAAAEGGARYFVNETTYILGMVEYEWFFDSGDSITDTFDDGRFVYVLGIGFRW